MKLVVYKISEHFELCTRVKIQQSVILRELNAFRLSIICWHLLPMLTADCLVFFTTDCQAFRALNLWLIKHRCIGKVNSLALAFSGNALEKCHYSHVNIS